VIRLSKRQSVASLLATRLVNIDLTSTDESCVVRPDGFEPPTLCSEDRCSNPLSYGRIFISLLIIQISELWP
jgi:hypothetical protein